MKFVLCVFIHVKMNRCRCVWPIFVVISFLSHYASLEKLFLLSLCVFGAIFIQKFYFQVNQTKQRHREKNGLRILSLLLIAFFQRISWFRLESQREKKESWEKTEKTFEFVNSVFVWTGNRTAWKYAPALYKSYCTLGDLRKKRDAYRCHQTQHPKPEDKIPYSRFVLATLS